MLVSWEVTSRHGLAVIVCCAIASCCHLASAAGVDSLVVGDWILERMSVGPELSEFPFSSKMGDDKISLRVTDEGSGLLRLQAKVVNRLAFTASAADAPTLLPFQTLHVNPGISTMMMGPAAEMEAETAFSKGLAGADRWYARDDHLIVAGPTIELSFARNEVDMVSTSAVGRQLGDGQPLQAKTEEPFVEGKKLLRAKVDELRSLRITLRNQGAASAEIAEQTVILLKQVQALKQKVGRSRFEDIVPMPMPAKLTAHHAKDLNSELLASKPLGLVSEGVLV